MAKEKKKSVKKCKECVVCGSSINVKLRLNYYYYELTGKKQYLCLCKKCAESTKDDI